MTSTGVGRRFGPWREATAVINLNFIETSRGQGDTLCTVPSPPLLTPILQLGGLYTV